ncbi:MAG: endolytic transglycosylase MltG [Elusimicrobiota bacterium]
MNKKSAFLVGAGTVLALLWAMAPGPPIAVDIPPGLSAAQTAALLKKDGVIGSEWLFRAAAKISRADRKIKPGPYYLRRRSPIFAVLLRLERGSEGIRILVPEGFSARQIARRLEAQGVCKAYDFMRYVKKDQLDGRLFPTTYFFNPDTPAPRAAQRMVQEFLRRMAPVYNGANPKPQLSLEQALILASIVEREAHLQEEKPIIAGVYLNRLKIHMRLQADPTVQYALGYWKKGLTEEDLRADSPYNTYLHYGLPPGPICNPGIASLEAVLHPANTDALYFVANNKGGHIFSKTNKEHDRARILVKREAALQAVKK